jgi:acetyl-CoA acetyltransferase
MRPKVSIIGVGTTGVGRYPDRSVVSLASEAVEKALVNAGIERLEIDGLISHIGHPRGIDYDLLATRLGLSVDFAAQPWSHGRFGATVLQHAAMAIAAGLATTVLCVAAYRNTPSGTVGGRNHAYFDEAMRDGGGPHAETPHAGFNAPVAGAAMATQRYLHKYDISRAKLAAVPIAMRRHARLNDAALMQKPLDEGTYLASPFIVEPLRLLDCSIPADGGVAIILTGDDRAADAPGRAVRILGMQGVPAGSNAYIFGQPGLGINDTTIFDFAPAPNGERVYTMAGVTPGEIQTLQVYDAFSSLVPLTLERFGFCGPGAGVDFAQNGRIELGGALPINTSGGMMSEGHLNGWNQFAEIIAQLRNEAGDRQIAGVELAQWATALGDSIIFGRA